MSRYLVVTCELASSQEGNLTEVMASWPVLGCQVEDLGEGAALVTVYLDQANARAVPGIADALKAMGAGAVSAGELAEADWLGEYRRAVTPRAIGQRFWIDPHPASPTAAPEGRIHLLVEPRQAFGTGSHESTALVLQYLEKVNLVERSVLDVGTGSGILALAAAALGAKRVVGFDVDGEAVFVARQTLNEQIARYPVALFVGTVAALGVSVRFDCVLANLLPAQLEPMLPELAARLAEGGDLVISGLLAAQRLATVTELARNGLRVLDSLEMGEWVALRCRPTASRP